MRKETLQVLVLLLLSLGDAHDPETSKSPTTTFDPSFLEDEATTTPPTPPLNRPHIIIVIADDLGFNDVGFHGSPQIPTPNLDALAFSGVILNNYYVSPICTPSRSSLFTGKHPIHTGMQQNVIYGTTPYGLPLKEKLLPEYLKKLNYSTHLVGKWHLGHFRKTYTPTFRGFDTHFGYWTGHKDYYDNMAEESGPEAWGYDHRRGLDVSYDHWGEYTTDVYTDEAIKIIETYSEKKKKFGSRSDEEGVGAQGSFMNQLFLVVSHTAVHSANPYKLLQAPASEVRKFAHIQDPARRTYAAMVSKLDESVGKIVEALSSNDLLQNSIILFTTDNGGPAAGFNGNAASNWPLRGVKNTLYEGGVKGAAFVWSPLLQAGKGQVSNQLMHIQDWLPTLICGALNQPDLIINENSTGLIGINLWEGLKDPSSPSPRTELLHNIDDVYGNEGVRRDKWKLLHGTTYGGKWDYWFGPSGFEPNGTRVTLTRKNPQEMKHVEIRNQSQTRSYYHQLKSSIVGLSLSESGFSIPSSSHLENLRKEAQISCGAVRHRNQNCNLVSEEYCLFDLSKDPCEYANVAQEYPLVVEELKSLLLRYKASAVLPGNKPKRMDGLPMFWNYTWTNWMDSVSPCD